MNRVVIQRVLVAGLAASTAISVVWFLLGKRAQDESEQHLREQQTLVATLQTMLTSLRRNSGQHNASGTQSVQTMPKGPDQPGLLRELENAAQAAGVTLVNVSFDSGAGGTNGTVAKLAISSPIHAALELQGPEDGLLNFVHTIQSTGRTVIPQNLQLEASGNAWQMSLQVDFPFQR